MTENTSTMSNATTCDCYNRGREDMKKEVLKTLDRRIYRKDRLEPLSVANFASGGQLNERTPNAN